MTELPDFTHAGYSKEELKERLPLEYACARLGIKLNREGRGLCPLHSDTTPSFYLYDHPADGAILWHCQPCGKGGDVLQLIMEVEDVPFPQALTRAAELLAELPGDFTPRVELDLAPLEGPADWAAEVEEARQRAARADGHLAARTGMFPLDSPEARSFDAYVRARWGWGIGADGGVYMPHWDAEGNLTGCKVRYPAGNRVSKSGSRYDSLYGAWLGRRHADCLLAEGEPDGVWAAYQASVVEQLPLDVLALPAGVRRPLSAEQLKFLAQRKGTVYLALDPDTAGVEGTRAALELLRTVGLEARVCILPLGRDLRDARPRLAQLLASARRPLGTSGRVMTHPLGGFAVLDKDGNARPVTNWHVEPATRLRGEESGFRVTVHSPSAPRSAVLKLGELASARELGKWANRHGLQYLGTDAERKLIADWVEARASVLPEEFLADRVGAQSPPAEYAWAGRAAVFPSGSVGKLPWRYAASTYTQDVTDNVLLPREERSGEYSWSWLEDFLALSSPDVTHPLLAWLVAAARRVEVQNFPLLFISGSSGTGKTTLAELALQLLGSSVRTDLGSNTPFILYRTLASTTTLPVFVDEWTKLSRRDTRETFQGLITILYAGGLAQRGQADLTVAGYRLTAPTIVAGEDTFSLDRERDRIVTITPTHREQNHLALQRLRGKPLELFGQRLHRWLAERVGPLPELDTVTSTRPAYNRRVLEAGWETLLLMLEGYAEADPSVPALPEQPDLSCFERGDASEPVNAYEVALEEGLTLRDQGGNALVWADPDGGGTWVRAQALIAALKRGQLDVELPGGNRAMLAYFQERYGELTESRVAPPGTLHRVRAHLIPGFHAAEPDALEALLT